MRVSHEAKRGCGYRQGGGLYLTSDGTGMACTLMPVVMEVCPTCGQGIKPARGWTWVEPDTLLPHHGTDDPRSTKPHRGCPLNKPGQLGERAGLLWIGESFYPTPASWLQEGDVMGFSRRISAVPRGFEIGQWVLVGHRKGLLDGVECIAPEEYEGTRAANMDEASKLAEPWPVDEAQWTDRWVPAIFYIWRPERIEYVVRGDETDEELAALEERGIEPVQVVPVGDTLDTDEEPVDEEAV